MEASTGYLMLGAAAALLTVAGALLAMGYALLRRTEADRDSLRARLRESAREHAADRAQLVEAEQEARAAAERAARAKDDLLATVSHELRTPLGHVLGWARLLRSGKLDAATTARAAEHVERSASAQAQIVDDLLDIARIGREELRLDVVRVDLVPVVEAAVDSLRAAAAAGDVAVVTALSPNAANVAGDPRRLEQVVRNLLSNAVKFTPPGGSVEIRLDEEGGNVILRVRDTGEGIDAAFLPHLFERFSQADSSSTRAHGGLGIGLAIVRYFVEAHGGTVNAASEGRGKGATFTVRLPVHAPARASPAGPPEMRGADATPHAGP